MQKTLGGDRLGSGKRMKVDLHGYERSTHDLSYLWRSTMAAGTLVPFMCEVALPGDTFDINLNCQMMTHPTIGPLFGSYKVQLDVFQAPIRLYNSLLHNNALGIGLNMSKVKLPALRLFPQAQTTIPEDVDNSQINPSCLLSYLGIRGIGWCETASVDRSFNGVPLLAYWEIYKNYYSNKQEGIGAVIHTPAEALVQTVTDVDIYDSLGNGSSLTFAPSELPTLIGLGFTMKILYTGAVPIPSQIIIKTLEYGDLTAIDLCGGFSDNGTLLNGGFNHTRWGNVTAVSWRYRTATDTNTGRPAVATFDLDNIDDMRKSILQFSSEVAPYDISSSGKIPYVWLTNVINSVPNSLSSQEGLGLKTYQSDLFNNWLDTEAIDGTGGISEITAISTAGDSFTIDTLVMAKKVYNMLNRIAVSGGTYDDWLDAVYGDERYKRAESPMYMGGLIKELEFQEVVSNSQTEDQPLGTLAGRGVLGGKHKGGNIVIKVDEPSYIIGIISLTPRLDYSQGNKWDTTLQTLDDLHKPALDEIGFQELITEKMAWWDTYWNGAAWVQKSAGKQPAWIDYMTNVNQTRGNFAIQSNEMFMTLNRRYEAEDGAATGSLDIADLTTYIDPSKFNNIFAETALDAQNFWAQIAVNIEARRKMSAKVMPNL